MFNNINKLKQIKVNYVLRKTKSFNKSRYSRNRQYYRTGVFMCLWANIILVLGSYYLFFRLTLKFNYLVILSLSLFFLVTVSYFSRNAIIGLSNILKKTIRAKLFILIVNLLNFFLKLKLSLSRYCINYLLNFLIWVKTKILAKIDKLNRSFGRFEID